MPAKKKKKPEVEQEDKVEEYESCDTLKDMVSALNELPTDVLDQLLKNLEAIEAYNKAHPDEVWKDDDDKDGDK